MRPMIAILALAALPALVDAQETQRGKPREGQQGEPRRDAQPGRRAAQPERDRARDPAATAQQQDTTPRRARMAGRRGRAAGHSGLTHDQLHRIQTSLARIGCYSGRADGMMGPQTRRGLACARRHYGVNGNNVNELFRAMSLDFTVRDSIGMGGVMRGGGRGDQMRQRDTRDHRDLDDHHRDHRADSVGTRKVPYGHDKRDGSVKHDSARGRPPR